MCYAEAVGQPDRCPRRFQVRVTISKAIANEYIGRFPDGIPIALHTPGNHYLNEQLARVVLADAEFNADAKNGPEYMPSGTRRAYAALAAQIRALL
jgi:hypothetical protein